jgi:hypothetical protein
MVARGRSWGRPSTTSSSTTIATSQLPEGSDFRRIAHWSASDHSRYESLKRVSIGYRGADAGGNVLQRRAGRDREGRLSRRRMIGTSLAVALVGGGHAAD